MPGTVICVRFGEEELIGLDMLCRDWATTRSRVIRGAVSRVLAETRLNTPQARQAMEAHDALMLKCFPQAFDKDEAAVYDRDDLPESPSGGRSEPDVVPPPATQRLPAPPPPAGILRSRSQKRRIAAQKGEPAPEFGVVGEVPVMVPAPFGPPVDQGGLPPPMVTTIDTSEMSADELDAWFNKMLEDAK
jgi:hypothetical protein